MGHMSDLLVFEGVPADHCTVQIRHRPRPLRFIWHHVLPKICGGKTVAENLTQLCDNCHYAVHDLMWRLANGQPLPPRVDRQQLAFAQRGYDEAVAAGTAHLIPRESST